MSTNFTGATFSNQKVTPSDDAIVRRAILPDGILTGCELSYSGSTLTMAAGHLIVCGRQIRHPSAQNWAVSEATSGYARLLLTIDLTGTATKEAFDQVSDSIEYATSADGFPDLEQADINGPGVRYQVAVCVVSLGAGGITGIVSQLEKSEASGGLNFKVVGGATQPSDPSENMIWVNTDVEISSWIFSPTEPADPAQGMIWIKTGTSSPVKFNALKKNGIVVCPSSAKQYISGAWVGVTAKSYIGGSWVSWITHLYSAGNTCDEVTGGWVGYAKKTSADLGTAVTPTVTYNEDSVTIAVTTTSYPAGMWCTAEKIDLSGKSTLDFDGYASANTVYLSIWSDIGTYTTSNQVVAATISAGNRAVTAVDVSSLEGSYYIGFQLKGNETKPSVTMYEMWAE